MIERIDKVMASAIDSIDRVSDSWQIVKAKICLNMARRVIMFNRRILALNHRITDRMIEYAAVIVEAEEGAKV